MLKRLSLAFIALFLLIGICYAITPDEAKLVSVNWLKFDKSSVTVKSVEPIIYKDVKVGYLVNLSPEGFIIVPDVKLLSPIKFWSKKGTFRKEGFLLDVLEEMYIAKMGVKRGDLSESKEQPAWAWLEGRKAIPLEEVRTVEKSPLITTKWNQDDPYNKYCPQVNGAPPECNGKAPAGCAAIATAQIMRYYRCPITGVGSHSYYWQYGGRYLSANFNHSYDWLSMPDTLNGATSYQIDQVAQAIYDIGVAVEMRYGPDGSGTNLSKVMNALKTYFKYNPDTIRLIECDLDCGSNLDCFYNILRSERDAGRVVELAIFGANIYTSEQIGHAVVMDGYRETIYNGSLMKEVHLNMGWGGYYDAYYALDNIYIPGNGDYYYDYPEYQAIIGIEPTEQQNPQPQPSGGGGGGCSIGKGSSTNLIIFMVILLLFPLKEKLFTRKAN